MRLLFLFPLIVVPAIAPSCGTSTATMRPVAVSISGLPGGRRVDVWQKVWIGATKLATVVGPTATISVPEDVHTVEVTVPPTPSDQPGVRYVSDKKHYNLSAAAPLNLVFKTQYQLSLVTSKAIWGEGVGGGGDARPLLHYSPSATGGWYDAGTAVTITASKGDGLRFGWWVITDAPLGHIAPDINAFSSAANPLKITLRHPTALLARFVGEWQRIPFDPNARGIVVKNIVSGQKVDLVDHGTVVASVVKQAGKKAVLPVTSGRRLSGQFVVTAPDGRTVVFESAKLTDLQAGDDFFY